ncbi:gamma-glutamyl-gamma-aminobutyrate hydrolase [Arboricoccus pini]|uniref:gamma-glutamyl-gamma-aminobutyrate hydrolase n=1 Tax=Arboricoccus pini TaxID=1963835 RepID=A0A212RDP5_9PROT|nr:gamma-glutamyl-gamma-aminobutyrate hydrolase family protein [Arboricoccus pini]SNB70226.1 gamma-glutamyl-gamma-aminobutyrate hydrolase [Arboricoccus pini]
MPEAVPRPFVGITACLKPRDGGFFFHSVSRRYVDAVVSAVDAVPVLLPAIGDAQDIPSLLSRMDGLVLTGSPSNVDPAHYNGPAARPDNEADPARDATTLPLIRAAIQIGLPVLAICRGIQELNVALGGSLHQHVQELPGRFDHRSDKSKPIIERFLPCHAIRVRPDGVLAPILVPGEGGLMMVNSLHGQGLDRVAPSLVVEAEAEDGTIEAVSMPEAKGFVIGVQWHPEYAPEEDPHSKRLFKAFGDAVRAFANNRAGHVGFQRVA